MGSAAVVGAERTATLACLDRAWRNHLAACADVREGIHLVRLGGQDPLTVYTREAIRSYGQLDGDVEGGVLSALEMAQVRHGQIEMDGAGLGAPAATWTYLVNDDPFEHRMGAMLTGPGGASIAIYSAALLAPLLLAWGAAERWRVRLREWR